MKRCKLAALVLTFSAGLGAGEGAAQTGTAADFASNHEINDAVVYSEVTHSAQVDTAAVEGVSAPQPYWGLGGRFLGGFIGVLGRAVVGGEGERYGVTGYGRNGSTGNFGFYGEAQGGDETYGIYVSGQEATTANYGVYAFAYDGDVAYGIYGQAQGATENYAVYASGDLAYTGSLIGPPSDLKFKEDVQPFEDALSNLMQVRVRTFVYQVDPELAHMQLPAGRKIGFVAQEVEEVLPEIVVDAVHPPAEEHLGERDRNAQPIPYKALKEMDLIPYLVRAIQQQQEEIQSLKAQIAPLQNRLVELERSRTANDELVASAP